MTRGRLNIRPISEADRRLHRGLLSSIPSTADAIALSYGADPHALDGVLVKVRHTGSYAVWRGLALEQISQRKAAAAIEAIQTK